MHAAIALLGFLFLLSPARADNIELEPVRVPFELLKTRHMVVKIKINGKGPYRVIFDTGSPVTLINTKTAKDSGLIDKKARGSLFGFLGSAGQATIKELEVGDLKAEKVPAIVMDHPTVEAISKVPGFGPIEGIVGFPFFARYRMSLDYQAKEMAFTPTGFNPPDIIETLTATLTTMMQGKAPAAKVVVPAAQWGLVVHKADGDEDAGVTVKEVLPGSAAAEAGIKAGDRLLTLDGRWTDTVLDCYHAAGAVKPDAAVKVGVKRGEKDVELTVKPRSGL